MIGLSITGFKDLKNLLTENVFKNIDNIVGFNLSYKNYEDWIQKVHENEIPFYSDNNLNQFIQNNNIKIKNIESDLFQIFKKYDKEYETKMIKEKEKLSEKFFWLKINKLNLENLGNLILKEKNENEKEQIKENNINNKYINLITKNLDENKRKIILANNLLRRDGRDWLTCDSNINDFNEKLKDVSEQLNTIADKIIIKELYKIVNTEYVYYKNLFDNKKNEYNNEVEIINKKQEEYNINIEEYNKKNNDELLENNK